MDFDKIKRLPLLLLTVYFGKVLVNSSPTLIDGAILLILGGVAGFYEAWSQLDLMKQIEAKIKKFEEKQVELEKADQEIKTYVTSLKLGQQIRLGGNGR